MVRFREAVMAVVLGTGALGCEVSKSQSHVAHYSIWHCDECDDFPAPAYDSGHSMMPGTYTGEQSLDALESNRSANGANGAQGAGSPPQQPPGSTPPPPTATNTPPTPPAAAPRNDLPVPAANP